MESMIAHLIRMQTSTRTNLYREAKVETVSLEVALGWDLDKSPYATLIHFFDTLGMFGKPAKCLPSLVAACCSNPEC